MNTPAPQPPSAIAGYEDWPIAVRGTPAFRGDSRAATELGAVLGLRQLPPTPTVMVQNRRSVEGIDITELRWSVGYGPDTTGWVLRPTGLAGDLPGVLGMHCHGGVRSVGAAQLVDLGDRPDTRAARLRSGWYAGRAPANELARRGFVVLVHDAFSWGSRRFDLSHPTPRLARTLDAYAAWWRSTGETPSAEDRFDLASSLHEDTIAKAAGVLGQTFAGAVLTDDLVALNVLATTAGVDADRLSTFGFSGGGGRALLLAALDQRVDACVVACMMATFSSLVPDYLDAHSWLLHVPGLWSFSDWPDLTRQARARFLVQYRREDPLFPPSGMAAAHERLSSLHGQGGRYVGSFSAGGHEFSAQMQEEAFAFLARVP